MQTETRSTGAAAAAAALRARNLIAAAGTAATILAALPAMAATTTSTSSSSPVTPESVDPVKHTLECLKLLFTDPAAHAEYCGPGHTVFVNSSTGYSPPYSCDG